MSRQVVRLQTKVWNAKMTPQLLFAKMPDLLNAFAFVPEAEPDFVMFSDKFQQHVPARSVPIYFPGENEEPTWKGYNWAFTFKYDEELKDPRHLRFPNYTRLGAGIDLIKGQARAEGILQSKKQFCAFVYSHNVGFRNQFFEKLSKYKFIHAPGASLHNTGWLSGKQHNDDLHSLDNMYGKYAQKVHYLKQFKFTICFENESSIGYTSEKLYHAMLANSLPIYWGNPLVHRDFNTKSFINFHDYNSLDALIDRIIEVDKNDDLYLSYVQQPWYPENKLTRYTDSSIIIAHFKKIFAGKV
jgi:hypothetical protein